MRLKTAPRSGSLVLALLKFRVNEVAQGFGEFVVSNLENAKVKQST